MHLRRGWSLLLLPGGLAVGHMLGYWAARLQGHVAPLAEGGHNYVHTLLLVSVPLSLAVLARALLSGVRREPFPVRIPSLATQQVLVFLSLEVLEHQLAGVGPLESLTQPTTLWGIVAQVVVAAGIVLLLNGLGTVAGRLRRSHPRAPAHRPDLRTPVVPVWTAVVVPVWSLSRRGPPPAYC